MVCVILSHGFPFHSACTCVFSACPLSEDSCHSLLDHHKMQSSSSVPVLILVLCCMASAHNDIYNRAIQYLETSQDCNYPPNTPQWCKDALSDFFDNSDNITALPSILEKLCDPTCAKLMDILLECVLGGKNIVDFICVTYGNKYCYIISMVFEKSCLIHNDCNATCSDACRTCHVKTGNDFSCCLVKYRHFDFFNASNFFPDACGNRYNSCDAIAL